MTQVAYGLVDGTALSGVLCGCLPMSSGVGVHAGARQMMCEELWSVLHKLREARDQHFRNPRVVALPRYTKQRIVGCIAHERMLEGIDRGCVTVPENQARLEYHG